MCFQSGVAATTLPSASYVSVLTPKRRVALYWLPLLCSMLVKLLVACSIAWQYVQWHA
jgi:hypothetical protein